MTVTINGSGTIAGVTATGLTTAQTVTSAVLTGDAIPIGVGQSWTNVTGSRALSTTYTNSTGRPIFISVDLTSSGVGGNKVTNIYVNGNRVATQAAYTTTGNNAMGACAIVPNGATYSVDASGANVTMGLDAWWELR